MFVERECRWRISRTDKHDGTSALIVSKEIINQPFSVSFALGGGTNGYVFYFVNTLSFTRHYRDSLQTVIIEGKHLTSFQIFVYHAFLFICQQQQIQELFLVRIKQLYDSLVAAPYGEYVHGYGTQKPNGFKYKSNAQTLFNKVVELNEKCRPSYIDEQTIFQLSHTLEKEVEHVVGTYEEAIKPNAAQKRWQELDDKMNRATRQIHLDIYSLLSYIEETSHE